MIFFSFETSPNPGFSQRIWAGYFSLFDEIERFRDQDFNKTYIQSCFSHDSSFRWNESIQRMDSFFLEANES